MGCINPAQVGQEVEVDFPSNPSGKGYTDYVLWGDNGQPLAVVEPKVRQQSLQAGREAGTFVCRCFERMGYQRPVIFTPTAAETFYLGRSSVQHLSLRVRHFAAKTASNT